MRALINAAPNASVAAAWTGRTSFADAAPSLGGTANGATYSLVGANDIAVGISTNCRTSVSTDGATWEGHSDLALYLGAGTSFGKPIYAFSKFFAGSNSLGSMATSKDGKNWTDLSPNVRAGGFTGGAFRAGAFGAGTLYIVSTSPTAAISTTDGINWTNRTSSFPAANWDSTGKIASNGTSFVISGATASPAFSLVTAVSSDAGVTWGTQSGSLKAAFGNVNASMSDMMWTGSNYVAIASNGSTPLCATSTDGVTWTARSLGMTAAVAAMAWSGSRVLVGGSTGQIATSDNGGISWTLRTANLTAAGWGTTSVWQVLSATWTGTYFVIAGGTSNRCATSPDGITWTVRTTEYGAGPGKTDLNAITWNGSQFVAAGSGARLGTSSDGFNWTVQSGITTAFPTGSVINGLAWSGSTLCAVGISATGAALAATSADGITWTLQTGLATAMTSFDANAITYGNGLFCVVGERARIATSADGITWTLQTGVYTGDWFAGSQFAHAYGVKWTGTQFCVVGVDGRCATSPDGSTWTYRAGLASSGYVVTSRDIAWSGTQFCVGGDFGGIATSPDGVTWTNRPGLSSTPWGSGTVRGLSWAGSKFHAVGESGRYASSPDGITWAYDSGFNAIFGESHGNALAWNGSVLVAVGGDTKMATLSLS